jgi:hypothetical protein
LGNDTTGTFNDKNVGTGKSVTAAMTISGTDAGDYTLTQPSGLVANITPVVLNLTGTRVYDAGTDADAGLFGSSGILSGVNGETLTLGGGGTLSSKNVNPAQTFSSLTSFTLTGDGSALASNYTLTGGTDRVNITPLAITVAATGANKVYDANTADAGAMLASSGVLAGDTVNFTDTSATFADKNVGTGKTVSVSGISAGGTDAGNYSYNTSATTTANITPATLAVTGTVAANRIYDGAVTDTLSGATLSGVLGSDTVALRNDTTGTFNNKNVGTGKSVTTAMTISGTDAGDYVLTQPSGLTANITPLAITVAATGTNKVYDGNTTDKVVLDSNGIVSGDALVFTSAAANFANAGVGNDKPVSVTGIQAVGSDAGNYTLTSNSATTVADITSGAGIQDTAVAVGYLELSPDAIATPYGVAPSESPGQLTGNLKLLRRPVEPNQKRGDFQSGLSLLIVDGGVRMPTDAP